tara:strand:+ start:1637 stop:2725 length:1089 start_codon:yes stop_codon:yes gene_type:complete
VIKQISVSVIVPVYNGEFHIKKILEVLLKQDFTESYEIIMVDDGSTDNSFELIKKCNLANVKLFSLSSNSGPSAARNLGLKKAIGEYVFFIDVDDSIEKNTLSTLYNTSKQTDCDFVCTDFKRIENLENQRDGRFNYPSDMEFDSKGIIQAMRRELHDPSLGHLGLFGCNGRLIRRSIIINNNISFEEKLRLFEDKTFCWDVLGFVRSARYIRKQLYSYYVFPKVQTAITEIINRGFPLEYIKLINSHIQNSLKRRGTSEEEIEKLSQQGLIFNTIQLLVSASRSMALGKVDIAKGKKFRRGMIKEVLNDTEILKAIGNYLPSKKESQFIPRAIALRSRILLEIACNLRAKKVIKNRRTGVN